MPPDYELRLDLQVDGGHPDERQRPKRTTNDDGGGGGGGDHDGGQDNARQASAADKKLSDDGGGGGGGSGAQNGHRQVKNDPDHQARLMELRQKYLTNRAIGDRAYYLLLVVYSLLIIFGTISNGLICLTVSATTCLVINLSTS